jgi:hypothetical protein
VNVPLLNGTVDLVMVPLPINVCTTHKLPKYAWSGLQTSEMLRVLRQALREHAQAVLTERAWITHRWLPTVPEA